MIRMVVMYLAFVISFTSCITQSRATKSRLCTQEKSPIKEIVAIQLHISEESVGWSDNLRSLGADNLDQLEIIMEVEKAYDLSIPNDVIDNLLTAQNIYDYVCVDMSNQ